MSNKILIITSIEGAENCARAIRNGLENGKQESAAVAVVEVAPGRRAALVALRRCDFAVVVIEENLAEADPEWAAQVWHLAGMAMPLQVNFALSGTARLTREVKAALFRRSGEEAMARRAVAVEMENDLRSSVTGLLLESELALKEPQVSPALSLKLRHLVELAGELRVRLRQAGERPAGMSV